MGSSCWADVPIAMHSKAVITAVREEYMIIVWKEWPMVFRTSSTATHNDDSRLERRHEGLKQEGKRQ